ncbi:SRPBCC domain-containing protein [Aeromonas sp. BIGb0445]|jgi:uncharacterized protein YndB with AHSA1/START domain|uniref:SRPBCC family protein n=1 Tax=Aeromonas sp. BIGb0445 TaxID=2940593 RepID=UPI002167CA7D|nr:SRPBCC domain-containing protein [Aeromonas sp. BIGb0445]MCS3458762.1 uncharacterized protein YndB with AHSA1/START domain [Aeromonas sp. BIGb0445]
MMRDIRHSFWIEVPLERVMAALMEQQQIQGWWTTEARIVAGRGVFGWSGYGWCVELDMEQDRVSHRVLWRCTSSNMQDTDAWVGTTISFSLSPEQGGTRLAFAQTGYRASPCFEICQQGWAYFIGTSLKRYLETGKGLPYPDTPNT